MDGHTLVRTSPTAPAVGCRQIPTARRDRGNLRFEPPALQIARYVTCDVEFHGTTVPQGSAISGLVGAANRDERRFGPDAESFDVTRPPRQHLTFGVGAHYCLGNALTRIEGRVALDEILNRFRTGRLISTRPSSRRRQRCAGGTACPPASDTDYCATVAGPPRMVKPALSLMVSMVRARDSGVRAGLSRPTVSAMKTRLTCAPPMR